MAVHTNVQQDARARTDEFNRDYIATEGGPAPAVIDTRADAAIDVNASNRLLHLLEKSAQTLRHTAENVENRGLKLLLKVLAQERVVMYNALRQAFGQGMADPFDPVNKSSGASLQEGLEDIQTSMTVQRQGRENVALTHLLEEEGKLLDAYDSATQGNTSSALDNVLESQRAHVAMFYARLQAVGGGVEPIVARVFDTRIEGESAVTRLQERGLDASQIDVATITQVTSPVLKTTKVPANPTNTMAAGAFSGALVGGIVGLALAVFVWMAPQYVGWVTVGPWALWIGAMVIGAVFGIVFGALIGQSQREDDLAVTADGLVNGEILVVAYPQPHQITTAEDVLQMHHARELNR